MSVRADIDAMIQGLQPALLAERERIDALIAWIRPVNLKVDKPPTVPAPPVVAKVIQTMGRAIAAFETDPSPVPGKPWSESEHAYLRTNIGVMPRKEIAGPANWRWPSSSLRRASTMRRSKERRNSCAAHPWSRTSPGC